MDQDEERSEADAQRRQARFSAMLNRLVAVTPTDGRIERNELDAYISLRTGRNSSTRLREYLAGTGRPRAKTAWAIGESLRQCGVTWASGLAVLFSVGLLKDFVGVILSFLLTSEEPPTAENASMLRALVHSVDELLIKTDVDLHPDLIGLHCRILDVGEMDSALRLFFRTAVASELDQDSIAHLFAFRERAKICWGRSEAFLPALDLAFKRWIAGSRELYDLPQDWRALLVVATSSDLVDFDREHGVRPLLEQWFDDFIEAAKVKPPSAQASSEG